MIYNVVLTTVNCFSQLTYSEALVKLFSFGRQTSYLTFYFSKLEKILKMQLHFRQKQAIINIELYFALIFCHETVLSLRMRIGFLVGSLKNSLILLWGAFISSLELEDQKICLDVLPEFKNLLFCFFCLFCFWGKVSNVV